MVGESLFFVREMPGTLPTARLLFPPDGGLQLTSASREVEYETPRDYHWDGNTVVLPAGSRIPFKDRSDLFPPVGGEHCMEHKRGEEKVGLYFGEGHLFHDQQVEASYGHQASWTGFSPRSQLDSLPCTAKKLASPALLKICVIGDSISAGCNASAVTGVPPYLPPYPELWAEAIHQNRQGEVILKNFAVSGTGMQYGLEVVEGVMREAPDLVVIAYGMNDVGFRPVEEFLAQASRLVEIIRERRRETEIILIATILGNPDWVYTPRENFFTFRDALKSLCGPGIALADLTSLWNDLLQVKSYHDLTGNGVNHPNDFGHRLYAQFLLELLGIEPQ